MFGPGIVVKVVIIQSCRSLHGCRKDEGQLTEEKAKKDQFFLFFLLFKTKNWVLSSPEIVVIARAAI